jgi:hypothetical protein
VSAGLVVSVTQPSGALDRDEHRSRGAASQKTRKKVRRFTRTSHAPRVTLLIQVKKRLVVWNKIARTWVGVTAPSERTAAAGHASGLALDFAAPSVLCG